MSNRVPPRGKGRTGAAVVAIAGIALTLVPIFVVLGDAGYHPVAAQLAAFGALLLVTAVLLLPIHEQQVATDDIPWKDVDDEPHTIKKGWLVPDTVPTTAKEGKVHTEWVSALRALYRGKDNRASTSKAVALAWTYAIVYGLLALLALKLMGDDTAWNALTGEDSLQEEYLLLLGGPFAAAIIAKYTAVATDGAETKTSEPEAAVSWRKDAKYLVSDDEGDTDLGDLQYVLFNVVALLFFFGALIPEPKAGFTDLPSLLVGLALTSAATYSAKKAATSAAGPQLASVIPTSATPGATVNLFGRSLVYDGKAPMISIAGEQVQESEISVVETRPSGDHIKFKLPTTAAVGKDHQVSVTTANGARARTPDGVDFLAIEVV